MGLPSIIRAFGIGIIWLGLTMLIPFIYAVSSNADDASNYLFGFMVTVLAGAGLYIATGARQPATDFRGGILLVLVWWVFAPVFAAVPFVLAGMPVADAYFETVSALTTTGAWLSLDTILADPVGLLWRAILQWFGGLVSIAFAASVIVRPAFYGTELLQVPFSRGERDSYLRSVRNALISFFLIYLFLTVFCFCVVALCGVPVFDAGIISLSIQSSGGLIPHADGLQGYPPLLASAIIPFIIFSGMNFITISYAMRGAWRKAQDNETEVYVAMIFIVGILFWILAGAGDLRLIPAQFFNAASLLSTNGLVLGEAPPLTVAIITVLVGGAAVSTAGGFKIQRWLVIMRRASEEIRRLISPNAVLGRSRIANELGVWMHFLVFTLFLAAMTLTLTFEQHDFELAAAAATATLSNTGPLLEIATQSEAGYAGFDPVSRWFMVGAMILGRIEAVAALALLNPAFWRS